MFFRSSSDWPAAVLPPLTVARDTPRSMDPDFTAALASLAGFLTAHRDLLRSLRGNARIVSTGDEPKRRI